MSMPIMLLVGAVIAATALGMFNRILGGVAGVVICLGVAAWGLTQMDAGATITFIGQPLSRNTFLIFVGMLAALNAVQIVRGIKSPRRKAGK